MTDVADRPTTIPTGTELVQRAADLVPMLRANAAQAHAERRLPAENLRAHEKSGILGSEIDSHSTIAVFGELARGCGSTARVATLYSDADFIVSHFPDEVQREISSDPNVHCTATLVPSARAERDGTGFRVNGKWLFNTGCLDGTWVLEPAVVELEAGKPEVCLFLMPYAELTILDDWHVSGLRGTGSNSVVGENVFVPEERMLRLEEFKLGHGRRAEQGPADLPDPGGPVRPHQRRRHVPRPGEGGDGAVPGAPAHPRPDRLHRLRAVQRGADRASPRGGGASLKIRSGHHLMSGAADILSRHAQSGEPHEAGEIPEIWGMVSYSTRLSGEAIETLRQASGASGIHESQPIQLVSRDAQALTTHAVMMPTTGIEIYGRSLCGLSPNTPML